jgi:hypothetical protein
MVAVQEAFGYQQRQAIWRLSLDARWLSPENAANSANTANATGHWLLQKPPAAQAVG